MDEILDEVKRLSPEELRAQLKEFGESVGPILPTTKVLFQKRLARKILASRSKQIDNVSSCASTEDALNGNCSSITNGVDEPVKVVQEPEPKKAVLDVAASQFFGVCLPPTVSKSEIEGQILVFSDKLEALKAVKKYAGARFKVFKKKGEAEEFSQLSCADASFISPWKTPTAPRINSSSTGNVSGVALDSCPYKAPKQQELIDLRKAIETGDCRSVETMIWENPRLLISSGDTPVILQDGFRYNALHIAGKSNQSAVCQLILDTLEDPSFIDKLWSHTKETPQTRSNRINFVVDLYLNTPDKGNCESALHFACKFGFKDVVAVLVAHPRTDKSLTNKNGQTASEIAGSRCKSPDISLKEEILDLLEGQYYVPLMRSEDNTTQPVIGQPWSPDSKAQINAPSMFNPKDPLMAVKACAGPMTPSKAEVFHKKWATPPSGSPKRVRQKYVLARREDSDKGMERLGRELAQTMNIPWLEYWDFLQTYVDLSSDDGLDLLEDYFQKQKIALCISDGIEKLDIMARSFHSTGGNILSASQMTCSWNLLSLAEQIEQDLKSCEAQRANNLQDADLSSAAEIVPSSTEVSNQNCSACKLENGSVSSNGTPPAMKSSLIRGHNLYSTPVSNDSYSYNRSAWLSRSMERSDIMNQSVDSVNGSASPISCLSAIFAKLSLLDRSRPSKSSPKSGSCTSCMGDRSIFHRNPSDYPMDASYASYASYASSKPYGKVPYFKEAIDTYNAYMSSQDGSVSDGEPIGQNGVPISVWKRPTLTKQEKEILVNEKLNEDPGDKVDKKASVMAWRDNVNNTTQSDSDHSSVDKTDEMIQSNDSVQSHESELDDSLDELTNRFKHRVAIKEAAMTKSCTDIEDAAVPYTPTHLDVTLEMDRDKICGAMFESLFEILNERKNVENVRFDKNSPVHVPNRQDIVLDVKDSKIVGNSNINVDIAVIPYHSSVAEISLFKDIPFIVTSREDVSDNATEVTDLPSIVDVKFNFGKDTLIQALVISNALKSKMFFVHGYRPTKSDLDVNRALESVLPDKLDGFPFVREWKKVVSSYTTDKSFTWESPAKVRKQSHLSASFPLGSSPQRATSPVVFYPSPVSSSPRKKMSSTWSMPNLRMELFPAGVSNRWSMTN